MGSFPQFPSGRRSALGLRNFLHHLMILPAGYVFCSFPSQRKTQTFYSNKISSPFPVSLTSILQFFLLLAALPELWAEAERNHTDSVVSRRDQCYLLHISCSCAFLATSLTSPVKSQSFLLHQHIWFSKMIRSMIHWTHLLNRIILKVLCSEVVWFSLGISQYRIASLDIGKNRGFYLLFPLILGGSFSC